MALFDFLTPVGEFLGDTAQGATGLLGGMFAPAGQTGTPTAQTSSTTSPLSDWLNQVGILVKDTVGIWRDVYGTINPPDIPSPITAATPAVTSPTYNPNISISDLLPNFNYYLIGFGVILLVIVFLRKA
ncbi:MAG: hypothetical protein A2167_05440 [Planctomycetes bacterium RBG_13_46_10]|nr:MAG: hypothetical protein A2167_05440 [Planctomycetes bacterium RBG_13_46_10]